MSVFDDLADLHKALAEAEEKRKDVKKPEETTSPEPPDQTT